MSVGAVDAFLRDLGLLYRVARTYPEGNQRVAQAARRAAERLARVGREVKVARVGEHLVVDDRTLPEPPPGLRDAVEALARLGWDSVRFSPGMEAADLQGWARALAAGRTPPGAGRGPRLGTLVPGPRGPVPGRDGLPDLTGEVAEILAVLGARQGRGLDRARDIVGAIAGHLAAGGRLLCRTGNLKRHDAYTHTHALNVCVLASALARILGAPESLVDDIALAALCHDVGKESVPPEILNKNGRLDPEEKRIMDRHPVIGARVLAELGAGAGPLLPVVAFQHHVGPDGSGYPEGAGRPHPASLLVGVCDVYDALRTARPYRGPLGPAEATTILLDMARKGSLYPPYVGELLRALGALGEGAEVTLCTGESGEVGAPGEDPLRPAVVTRQGGTLDLGSRRDLWICRVNRVAPTCRDPEVDPSDNRR